MNLRSHAPLTQRSRHRARSWRRIAVVTAVFATVTPAAGAFGTQGTTPGENTLTEAGVFDVDWVHTDVEDGPPPLIVDATRNLGFAVGEHADETEPKSLVMFDLARQRELVTSADGVNLLNSSVVHTWALDTTARRIIAPAPPSFTPQALTCLESSPTFLISQSTRLDTFEYAVDPAGGTASLVRKRVHVPCVGRRPMVMTSVSVYERPNPDGTTARKLLATGTYGEESYRRAERNVVEPAIGDNLGQPLAIRQFDLDRLYASESAPDPEALDWEIDVRAAGCGRRDVYLAERVGEEVVSYCQDLQPGAEAFGEQGYVLRVPLGEDHHPLTREDAPPAPDPTNPTHEKFVGNPVIRRTPALPGSVFPFVDPVSRRLLLLTADSVNGNAVWVFDPAREQFIGVMTGGVVGQSEEKTAAGFDPVNGRAFLLTDDGILAASVRHDPLPGGQVYPVVDGVHDGDGSLVDPELVSSPSIVVLPRLRQLFVPVVGRGYVVVDDGIEDPRSAAASDPDSLTTQVDEREGVTAVNASAEATAVGMNTILVGGLPRAANQLDPLCHSPNPLWEDNVANRFREQDHFGGSCLADQFVTRGTRRLQLAHSEVGTALGSDATADSSGLMFPESDQATSNDIKELGDCGYGFMERLQRPSGSPPQSPRGRDGGLCAGLQEGLARVLGDDLRQGTRGGEHPVDEDGDGTPDNDPEPGHGFPVPASSCTDFTGDPTSAEGPGGPTGAAFSSAVSCDAATSSASATSNAGAFAFPDGSDPLVSVGRTSSRVTTSKTTEGQVTTAIASTGAIQIGPVHIGEVHSIAVARARGRTGTAEASHQRIWCGVSIETTGVEDADGAAAAARDMAEGPPPSPPALAEDEILPDEITPEADPPEDSPLRPPTTLVADCIDPDTSPEATRVVDEINQALGRVRVTLPQRSVEATAGGYQAVVIKASGQRSADQAVNDDDSVTTAGLQLVLFNDGPEGRSRVVAQFAGVHTESRYGIVLLPDFDVPESPDVGLPASVGDVFVPPSILGSEARTIQDPVRIITIGNEPADNPLAQFFNAPAQALQNFLSWLINNPLEAALLFMLLSLLAAPIYLTLRARAAARALEPSEL